MFDILLHIPVATKTKRQSEQALHWEIGIALHARLHSGIEGVVPTCLLLLLFFNIRLTFEKMSHVF